MDERQVAHESDSGPSRDRSAVFPVVGIGASAGGMDALSQLFSTIPGDTGMAFLVVLHLAPDHESRLAEILGRRTSMPVVEATQALAVEPNHVYVIPPNTRMALAQGRVHLAPRNEGSAPHLPIDYLFRSLAEDRPGRAVAVVLSGTGSDGTQGLCEVKSIGGITFAQSEETATHPGMPRSAIDSGCVDFVLAPEDIAHRLEKMGAHPYLAAPAEAEGHAGPPEGTAEHYHAILDAVRAVTGMDFSLYRDTTIRRRIMRRMALHAQESLGAYADRLKGDAAEVEALSQDLLVSVTSFFRDPDVFTALKTVVFPKLAADKPPNEPVRVWVPGCSTGQEAYSLAIALVEFYDGKPVRPPIQIFSTDLGEKVSLDRARGGLYPEGIEGEVSAERLRRFFHHDDHGYRVHKMIRDLCVFARHDVTTDPPFSHVDLISCRNLLIYLTTPLQKRVLAAFHYALNVPGYLLLGSAETAGEQNDLFELAERTHRIYAKKPAPARQHVVFASPGHAAGASYAARRSGPPGPATQDFQKEADRILLGRYSPPSVLVDENFDILQFRGHTSRYLEAPSGEPTTNVLKMAREGLFLDLRNALSESKKDQRIVRRRGIRLRDGAPPDEIAIEVVPVSVQSGVCYLVLFDEPPSAADTDETLPQAASEGDDARELVHLRQELVATREYLQSMVEQQDAANEELRSANEEILSSNEELQSTNEELETAKEELQSSNEELTTVNEQLQRRNQELDLATNDLVNLLASTGIPVVMVGADLCIRRFTPPAARALDLVPADVGRSVSHLQAALALPELETLVGEVLERVQAVEREIRDRNGRWQMLRIHPYRTADNRIDGAVLVLVDVDQLRRDQETLRRHEALIELSQDAVIIRDAANAVVFWNTGATSMYGWTGEEAKGQPLDALLQTDPPAWAQLNATLDRTGQWEGELHQRRRDGSPVLVHCREVLVRDEHGRRAAVLAIKRDVTELRQTLEALREADRRKDQFMATLAHELRNPLAPIRNAVEIMRLAPGDRAAGDKARNVIDRQVHQLVRIVDDLLDVTRIVEGKVELRKERMTLGSIIDAAVETCRPAIEAQHHELVVQLPNESLQLDADRTRLSQALINLLTNAAKYTPPHGRIVLAVERAGGATGGRDTQVVLRVQDDGIGIPSEELGRVFDIFVQGAHTASQGYGGLGVGLTLVRSVVEMHGGSVEARSDGPNRGSEFVLRLPLASGLPPALTLVSARQPKKTRRRKRVLVVDDNVDQTQSLGTLVGLMGHEARMVTSGREALEMLEEFQPDVVLVDIGLPGMDGHEVARRIREHRRFRRITLVAQTGWGQEEDRLRSIAAGFDRHVVKPVTREALEEILGTVRPPKPPNPRS